MPAARVRSAIAAVGLVVALSGCAGRLAADGPASVPSAESARPVASGSPSTAPAVPATDDLAGIQTDLDQAASAQGQSQNDLTDADAASRQGDDN